MSKNWFPKTQNIYEILLKKISSLFNKVNDLEVTVSSNALPDQTVTLSNNMLSYTPIEIRVYN